MYIRWDSQWASLALYGTPLKYDKVHSSNQRCLHARLCHLNQTPLRTQKDNTPYILIVRRDCLLDQRSVSGLSGLVAAVTTFTCTWALARSFSASWRLRVATSNRELSIGSAAVAAPDDRLALEAAFSARGLADANRCVDGREGARFAGSSPSKSKSTSPRFDNLRAERAPAVAGRWRTVSIATQEF